MIDFKELFNYCDGKLYWKIARQRIRVGDEAGNLDHTGYIHIKINYKQYRAHRIIWQMFKGEIPAGMEIDHINGIRNDNRIENLRLATPSQNQQNQRKPQGNNPYLGVCWNKGANKWAAHIRIDGKLKHLGYFATSEAAHEAYLRAKRELHEFCTI